MNYRELAEKYATNDVGAALTWIVDQGGETDDPPPGMDEWDRMEMGKFLVQEGLIHVERTAAGEWTISSTGKKVAQDLAVGRQKNGWLRRQLIVREMLAWIDREEPRFSADFAGQVVDDIEVTEAEVRKAENFLQEHELVKGVYLDGTLMTPTVTSKGDWIRDHSDLPERLLNQGGGIVNDQSNTVHVSGGNVGAVNAGNNGVQSGNSVSVQDSGELLHLIQSIQAELAQIEDVPPTTTAVLGKLNDAAQTSEPQKSQLQELVGAFLASIGSKVADASWSGVLKSIAAVSVIVGL